MTIKILLINISNLLTIKKVVSVARTVIPASKSQTSVDGGAFPVATVP